MDFVNVLRGLKKSRSEAKLGLSDRLTVGRKSSKTRIKSGGGGGTPIGDIPEDSTAPSLHSPLHSPARQPYSPPGEDQVEYFTKGEWMLSALFCHQSDFPASIGVRYSNLLQCFSCGFLCATRSLASKMRSQQGPLHYPEGMNMYSVVGPKIICVMGRSNQIYPLHDRCSSQ